MTEARGVRIGDAERDAAVAALGEHYAAGRLTKDEYDERAAQAWTARFQRDLDPIFTDLPRRPAEAPVVAQWHGPAGWSGPRPGPPAGWQRPPLWAFPLMLLAFGAVVTLAFTIGPWVLLALFWFGAFGAGHRQGGPWQNRPAGMRGR